MLTVLQSQTLLHVHECLTERLIDVLLQLEGGQKIRLDHMPDVLHPNAAGMEQLLTTCLDPALGLKPLELSE